jgi:hypothetical protein
LILCGAAAVLPLFSKTFVFENLSGLPLLPGDT